ncbi:MAG: TIGR00725 family protein [Candidatus Dormiibacterota bacterium]
MTSALRGPQIAVCGPSAPRDQDLVAAREVGALIAARGATLICGGLGGAMAAAAAGARENGGVVVGILPGDDPDGAGPDVEIALATGLGEMRNCLIARSAAAVIAIGGGVGTLSEIAFALVLGKPVAGIDTWQLQPPPGGTITTAGLHQAQSAQDAVDWALSQISKFANSSAVG